MSKPSWIIGVDESGTGAWAGPFTVCAFMCHVSEVEWARQAGARDSKTLSHSRRVRLRDDLLPCCTIAPTEVIPHDFVDQKGAWRHAIIEAVLKCFDAIGNDAKAVRLMIDGSSDTKLARYFRTKWKISPDFVVRGDSKIPQIAAASIYAKTLRTELMMELHATYPVYGWASAQGKGNDGYGTADHYQAVVRHGISPLHRRVKPLLPYFR